MTSIIPTRWEDHPGFAPRRWQHRDNKLVKAEQATGASSMAVILRDQCAVAGSTLDAGAAPGRSANCAAGENTRDRMRTVATRPPIPEAARIMATMTNW